MRILQARILEWVAMPSFRRSSQPRNQTQIYCIADGFFTYWTRIVEWVAYPFSRGCYQTRNRTRVSHNAGGFFTSWDAREAHLFSESCLFPLQWGLDHSPWSSGFSLSLQFLHFLEFPLTTNPSFLQSPGIISILYVLFSNYHFSVSWVDQADTGIKSKLKVFEKFSHKRCVFSVEFWYR